MIANQLHLGGLNCSLTNRFFMFQGDSDDYREQGSWFGSLKARFPTSKVLDFPTQNHGFINRGDISDSVVHESVLLALENIHSFFKANEDM